MFTKHILSAIFVCMSVGLLFGEKVTPTSTEETQITATNATAIVADKTAETKKFEGGGDDYDDEFAFSRRIRRFHHHNNGGATQQSWGYYDPYYASDIYYTVNTPSWNNYYYGSYYNAPMTTVAVRPTFWGVVAAVLFAPTYYNYGYYNPSPVGWGYYGGQGYYNGWNQCYWSGSSYGNGYYGGYNSGFYNGYNQGYNNGYANGYNQGYNDGYNNGNYNGYQNNGGNGDDWWYWKQQNPTPRPAMNTQTGKGGMENAMLTGGKNDIGINQPSIVRPAKSDIGVSQGNLSDRPVTSAAHNSMNSKPSTEPVRNGGVKWDTQTGDAPVRNHTQPARPTGSSEPSRPNTTSPAMQATGTRPQETLGTSPSTPARPQTQAYGSHPQNNASGFHNESRPNTNFDNRPNTQSYDNQQSSSHNSGNHSNPATSGHSNGERPNYDTPRTPQNGHNSGAVQNQPSISRPQTQTAPANTRPAKSNEGSVKFPAPTGRKSGLSYTTAYSIIP